MDGDPDLLAAGKCLCPEETTNPDPQGTMRSVYVYSRGMTHLYEKPGYNDMIT